MQLFRQRWLENRLNSFPRQNNNNNNAGKKKIGIQLSNVKKKKERTIHALEKPRGHVARVFRAQRKSICVMQVNKLFELVL